MIYLPSKIKYKYLFMIFIIIAQLIFMSHVHRHNYFHTKSQVKLFDTTKLPSVYKALISKISPSNFIEYSIDQRCFKYFDELNKLDENWQISDLEGLEYSIDVLSPQEYYKNKYDQLVDEFNKNGKDVNEIDTKDLVSDLNNKLFKNKLVEDKIVNSVGHLRVYGKCYINDNKQYKHCSEIETKLFPWLTFEEPVFERWDGTEVQGYPKISNYYRYEGQGDLSLKISQDDECLLTSLQNKFIGKGIVLSIDDHLVTELIKLLKTLRVLQNQLPIQFVHKGDLSTESKTKLIELARSNIVVRNARTIQDFRQEIWFVNVKRCLQETHYHKFYMYRNKWLLVLFNSFEEMVLMDTDVVSFQAPAEFFKFKGYQETGAFFFRDRDTGQLNKDAATELLLKLMPRDLENIFFDIPKLTNFTLQNNFFKNKLYHHMESGVVAMNRKTHLLGMLISVQLQFWDPIASHTHGDKELFWLGQLFAGDENYYFNPNLAGAVGKINDREYKIANVIVGTQPAHIAPDNETLLWVNSGLETCKKHSWERDFREKLKISQGFNSEDELKQYYLSPLLIEALIIPPDGSLQLLNGQGEPDKGWRQLEFDGCAGYLWGAYSRIGGDSYINDDSAKGLQIKFDPESVEMFNEVGLVWVNPDFYYYPENPLPTLLILDKYWKILDKFGNTLDYEKLVNLDNSLELQWEKWDDNDFLKLLS